MVIMGMEIKVEMGGNLAGEGEEDMVVLVPEVMVLQVVMMGRMELQVN